MAASAQATLTYLSFSQLKPNYLCSGLSSIEILMNYHVGYD